MTTGELLGRKSRNCGLELKVAGQCVPRLPNQFGKHGKIDAGCVYVLNKTTAILRASVHCGSYLVY